MKQRIFNVLLAIALIFCGSSAAFAQSKLLKKDIKKTCKECKNEVILLITLYVCAILCKRILHCRSCSKQ
jgi:hypothetical protein